MTIVLQCKKCGCVNIDDWAGTRDDGTLYLGRLTPDGLVRPRCGNCNSDKLIIGSTYFSGINLPAAAGKRGGKP